MKTMIFSFLLLVSGLLYPQEGWFRQNSGTTENLHSVYFIDSMKGWTVGNNGTILKSTDGGENWNSQFSGTNQILKSVYFFNSTHGWCAGANGVILNTTNGGINWITQNSDSSIQLESICFTNTDTGMAVGLFGIMLRTTNGGNTWKFHSSGTGHGLYSVYFADSLIGWEAGANAKILKTTNGGIDWVEQEDVTYLRYYSIFCVDTSTVWATGLDDEFPITGGFLEKSTDGGINWEAYTIFLNFFRPFSIHFTDKNNGWVVGVEDFFWANGKILKTSDGGVNWVNQQYGSNDFLYSVCFRDSNNGWVVGDSGTILKTVNGGIITETKDVNPELPSNFSISQNYPNPFNPNTIINYQIPEIGFVNLKLYDVLGNEIATLVNEEKPAGEYEVEFDGSQLTSGIYFYRLQVGDFIESRKMVLLK